MENKIIPAYNQGNKPITLEINRVIYYLSTAIKNAITMLDPESVVLYGELFKSRKFRYSLMEILNAYTKTQIVSFSNYNMQLEDIGPATMAISRFFMSGGVLPSTPYIPSAVPSSLEDCRFKINFKSLPQTAEGS